MIDRRRIEYPGAYYHVIQRGNNREDIFRQESDKYCYINNLVALKGKYDFKLLGFALMDNHYHLLLHTGSDPLQKIIFRQNMYYSRYFNKTHKRTGHLYGSRYKVSLIQDERYLFAALSYIHFNPVNAGICKLPEHYYWSSDACYRNTCPKYADTEVILKIICVNNNSARAKYIEQMQDGKNNNYEISKVIGDEDFTEVIESEYGNKEKRERMPLGVILNKTGVSDKEYDLIRSESRKRSFGSYKKSYIAMAVEQGYSYREIGDFINMTDSSVWHYCNAGFE